MQRTKRTLSLLLALMLILLQGVTVFAAGEPADEEPKTTFTITAETNRLRKNKTLQLIADTTNKLTWTSSDERVAVVDENGLVTGVKVGHAHITAIDKENGASAQFKVYVVRANMPWRTLLEKNAVLGYRYSYEDDFYYTDDLNCWQKFFGFNFIYDYIAPLMLFEYDYTRVFFNYGGKDWMIQLWKGQYGAVFYGSEVGVYNKPEDKKSASAFAQYAAADESDFLKIGTELYRKNISSGEFNREFETPYADHWWATGFVPGHLWDTTPCDELRLAAHITLQDEEMARMFADGLAECNFVEVSNRESVENDTFYIDGADVYLQWQNLSQAVNSHIVQFTFWGTIGTMLFVFLFFLTMLLLMFGGFGLFFLILI